MDSKVKLYLERAENNLLLAKTNFNISQSMGLKKTLSIPSDSTFFADVISEGYYAIFYASKAYLLLKGVETKVPDEHKKTYKKFREMVNSGELDSELLEIYESEAEKADSLLKIMLLEKSKRGRFTYDVNAGANMPYAEESVENARKFVSIIKDLIEKIGEKTGEEKKFERGEGEHE